MYNIVVYDTNGLGAALYDYLDESLYRFIVVSTLQDFKDTLSQKIDINAVILSFSKSDNIAEFFGIIKQNISKAAVIAMYDSYHTEEVSKFLDGFDLFLYMVRKPVNVVDISMFVKRSVEFYDAYKQGEYLKHAINQLEKGFFVVDRDSGFIEYMNDYARKVLNVRGDDSIQLHIESLFNRSVSSTILDNGFNSDFLTVTLQNGASKKMFLETFTCNGSIIVEMTDYTELEGKLRVLEEATRTFSEGMEVLNGRFGVTV